MSGATTAVSDARAGCVGCALDARISAVPRMRRVFDMAAPYLCTDEGRSDERRIPPGQIGDDNAATLHLACEGYGCMLEPNGAARVPLQLIGPLAAICHPGRVDLTAVLRRLELD